MLFSLLVTTSVVLLLLNSAPQSDAFKFSKASVIVPQLSRNTHANHILSKAPAVSVSQSSYKQQQFNFDFDLKSTAASSDAAPEESKKTDFSARTTARKTGKGNEKQGYGVK